MENYADNMENLAESSFLACLFYFFLKFAYGKLFVEACQVLFKNNSLSAFCTKTRVSAQRSHTIEQKMS